MDSRTKKILKYINKNDSKNFSLIRLIHIFPEFSKNDLVEIVNNLYKNSYVRYVGINGYIKSTNKGKTYFSSTQEKWISEHIIETLALVLSIIAIVVSIVALKLSMLK